jgi:putative ABC transport system permease protein
MTGLLQDVRHGFRQFARQPGLWALAVLTLSLGIGANATIFSIVRGILLKPLFLFDQSRDVVMWSAHPAQGRERQSASTVEFEEWRANVKAFERLVGVQGATRTITGDEGEPERIYAALVTDGFFEYFSSGAVLGRVFEKREFERGQHQVAVLSYPFWQRRYASSPAVIGKTVKLGAEVYTIIGVAKREFWFPTADTNVWIPYVAPVDREAQLARDLDLIGRLNPGATRAQAQQEVNAIEAQLAAWYPETHKGWQASVESPLGHIYPNDRIAIGLIHAIALGVLIIACSNLAILLLARAVMRQKEMAIRQSLGAARARLIRQAFFESLWLAVPAAVFGVVMAKWSAEILVRQFPTMNVPVPDQVIDWTVIAFTSGIALVSVLIFGLAPAWQGSRQNLTNGLRESGARSGASRKSRRLSRVFVIAQAALALALVYVAVLAAKGINSLRDLKPGFDATNVISARMSPAKWRYASNEDASRFFENVVRELRATPGVESAAAITVVPKVQGDGVATTFTPEDRGAAEEAKKPFGLYAVVTPGALETLKIPLLRGRTIEERDGKDGERVAVINQMMAKTYWPDSDPIGKRVRLDALKASFTVVGITGDIRSLDPRTPTRPKFYIPLAQNPARTMSVVIRTAGAPDQLIGGVRAAVRRVDREEPADIQTIEAQIDRNIEGGRTFGKMVLVFGGLALFMAAMGLFCLLSYSVTARLPEIGLRMALGAARSDVVRLIVLDCVKMLAIGVSIGLVLSFALGKVITSLLTDVSALDPMLISGSLACLAIAGAAAAFLPARRAASTDPAIVLRNE